MIRVLLADDQALMRAGFRALLDAEDNVEVVGEATDGAAAAAPRPSSTTSRHSRRPSEWTSMSTVDAWACLSTLVSASCTTR